ncbi:MAG: porin [Verrucomicrobiota bacterium JB023]|nr:porin [Verrucomicrobiota bacterium JB023]
MPLTAALPAEQRSGSDLASWPILHENPDAKLLQKVALTGRYQGFYANLDSNAGNLSRYETRRWRVGTSIEFLEDWTFQADINIDPDLRGFYESTNDLYFTYQADSDLKFHLGRTKAVWGSQWRQSSKTFAFVEWGQLVDQLRPTRAIGTSLEGQGGQWIWEAGLWSGHLDGEWSHFDRGAFATTSLGYDFANKLDGVNRAEWRVDTVWNEAASGANAVKPYERAVSSWLWLEGERWDCFFDAMAAWGGRPAAFGFLTGGTFDVTDRLELTARYEHSWSRKDGLRLPSRFARQAPDLDGTERGDNYHSLYAGFNYYLHGDQLKLVGGIQFDGMTGGSGENYDGVTYWSGMRLYF